MESKKVLEKILSLSQISKNYIDFLSQNSFDLENNILFFICLNDACSPQDMIEGFKIKKTNLAIICQGLIEKGLIEKQKNEIDARSISYTATEKGMAKLDEMCKFFDEKVTISDQEKVELCTKIDDIIKFFKF